MSVQRPWIPASPPVCHHRCAVCASYVCGPCGVTLDEVVREEGEYFWEPFIGAKDKEEKPGIKALPDSTEMTEAHWAEHCIKHLPFCDGCPYCVAGHKPNTQHRSAKTEEPTIPSIVPDYGFLREKVESLSQFLGLCIRPWKIYHAILCAMKGQEPAVVKNIAQLIRDCGVMHFNYKSGREPAVRSLLAKAAALAGVKAEAEANDEDSTGEDDDDNDHDGMRKNIDCFSSQLSTLTALRSVSSLRLLHC